jgi:hypothetical protein
MLGKLKKRGENLPITLEFEKAGKATESFDVGSVGAQGPGGALGTGGKMEEDAGARSLACSYLRRIAHEAA